MFAQDTALFYSLTVPTLFEYNTQETTISILLEIPILYHYDIVSVFGVFNLDIINHGKHIHFQNLPIRRL